MSVLSPRESYEAAAKGLRERSARQLAMLILVIAIGLAYPVYLLAGLVSWPRTVEVLGGMGVVAFLAVYTSAMLNSYSYSKQRQALWGEYQAALQRQDI